MATNPVFAGYYRIKGLDLLKDRYASSITGLNIIRIHCIIENVILSNIQDFLFPDL
jgi:hypothetical protein